MARIARTVIPGIPHHITQRGNRRQVVFFNEDDQQAYIELFLGGEGHIPYSLGVDVLEVTDVIS